MRIDKSRKSLDIEARDINYILSAYIRMYLFQTKNEDPDIITIPMYRSTPHPTKPGQSISIDYIPDDAPIAIEIKEDGQDIPEATPESEAEADKKEKDYDAIKARLEETEAELGKLRQTEQPEMIAPPPANNPEEPPVSPAQAALAAEDKSEPESAIAGVGEQPTPERLAKVKEPPGGAIPPGSPLDIGGKRDPRDFNRIKRDLMPEKEINEEEEQEIQDIADIKEPEGK